MLRSIRSVKWTAAIVTIQERPICPCCPRLTTAIYSGQCFPLFKRCEWLVGNCNVAKRVLLIDIRTGPLIAMVGGETRVKWEADNSMNEIETLYQRVLSNYIHRRHCVTQCPLVWKRVYQCISFTLVDTVLHSIACVRSWKAPRIWPRERKLLIGSSFVTTPAPMQTSITL